MSCLCLISPRSAREQEIIHESVKFVALFIICRQRRVYTVLGHPEPDVKVSCHREEEAAETHGHITSLAVARTHRKLGLATKLMQSARE